MLADPKSQALIDNFFGQWLYLRNLRNLTPDSREFPDFNGNVRRAMLEEMNLFLGVDKTPADEVVPPSTSSPARCS